MTSLQQKRWPKFFEVAKDMHAAVVNFYATASADISSAPEERIVQDDVPLCDATAISSQIRRVPLGGKGRKFTTGRHRVLMDIDVPHAYVPSTTQGHAHLIFDVDIPWDKYLHLLKVLADCGVIEPGYYKAAKARGEAWLRTPWTAKGSSTPEIDADEAQA